MKKNKIGSSDLYVSELGLGCMSLEDKQIGKEIIAKAIYSGVNFLDTADLYQFGLNEELVGEAIKDCRHDIILATKVGNRWKADQSGWNWDPSKDYIKSAVKESLRRLQTDYIDLYQLHGGTIEDHIDETIEAFEELKQEGLIRYYGISSIRPNVIREYINKSNIVSVMMQYSIFDPRPEEQILDLLNKNEISVIARGPLAKGLLTEHYQDKMQKFAEQGYLDNTISDINHAINQLKHKFNNERTLNEVALQYCLHHPTVATVIPGASSLRQLEENLQAINGNALLDSDIHFIHSVLKKSTYTSHR